MAVKNRGHSDPVLLFGRFLQSSNPKYLGTISALDFYTRTSSPGPLSTQSRAKSACRSSRKMSAAMSAMAAAPIRAASSRRAPRARTGAKVRAHPESPRRFILSLEGSREPLATNALAAPRGTRRRAAACGSGVPSRPRRHPRDSRLVLVARVDVRSFHRRRSSAAARPWRRARAHRTSTVVLPPSRPLS